MPTRIDWEDITDEYNSRNQTRLTESEMFRHAYKAQGSLPKMESLLGVCKQTIAARMEELGIKRNRSGGYYGFKEIITGRILAGERDNRSIAKKVGCSHYYVRDIKSLMKREGRINI